MKSMKPKVVGCIVARTNSSRLPEKVLKRVSGRRMIEHIIDRLKGVSGLDSIYIATSTHPDDQVLLSIAEQNNIEAYAGSELSVIDRLLDIAKIEEADYVVRVTGDNIYTDTRLLDLLIKKTVSSDADYARVEGAPIGVTAEVMKVTALQHCLKNIDPELSEYLMLYMFDPETYKTVVLDVSDWVPSFTSLTVDTPEDWERTEFIEGLHQSNNPVSLNDIVELNKYQKIPAFRLNKHAEVKLPHGAVMTLESFMHRQCQLAQKAQFFAQLSQEEYQNA